MSQRQDIRLRHLLSQECARIMANEGITDFLAAKRKASARLGISGKKYLPTNVEVEQALLEYQRLFQAPAQEQQLNALRQTALEAMRFLNRFRPRLVGQVLIGTATRHSVINLHLFADTPEDVMFFLMEHDIPFATSERRLRIDNNNYAYFPMISFEADNMSIEITIFSLREERDPPRSPVDGRPMQRANIKEVEALLQ